LSKPQNIATGFHLKIENTTDVLTMERVLSEYIEGYAREQKELIPANIVSPDSVNPFDWAPLNFDGSKWTPIAKHYNLGFLFRTTSDELMGVCSYYDLISMSPKKLFQEGIPSGVPLVVKHTNILLDSDFTYGITSIIRLIDADYSRKNSKDEQPLDIVHPYIAILGTIDKPLIVMKDKGEPLSDRMQQLDFRKLWAQSAVLRRAFFTQVGISALNLVDKVSLCHNDIRPPNIAVSGENFCLIDFDMCRMKVSSESIFGSESAFTPTIGQEIRGQRGMMCFSVAQIILSVFMLSSPTVFSVAEVTQAVSVWRQSRDSSSDVDREFETWVQSKGGDLLGFVYALRGSAVWPPGSQTDCKGYCTAVLECLLGCKTGQPSDPGQRTLP
jgi:serine/threonine protein kinase